jgi:hypothetical protein
MIPMISISTITRSQQYKSNLLNSHISMKTKWLFSTSISDGENKTNTMFSETTLTLPADSHQLRTDP